MKEGKNEIHISVSADERALGRAYVPSQVFECIYDAEKALMQGTCFKALDMPYMPKTTAGYR